MLSFRPMTTADRPVMLDICATVWDGDDYLPGVFDDWVADPQGQFTAAERDGRVVALAKLTRLALGEYWLEGIRVHGDFRGRGIASALHDYHLRLWRSRGEPGALRLLTVTENKPIIKLCERTGFTALYQATFVQAEAAPGPHRFAPLTPPEAEWAFDSVTRSPFFAEQHGLCDLSWQLTSLTRTLLAQQIAVGRAFRWGENEGALLVTDDHWPGGAATLVVQFPAAGAEQRPALISEVRALAASLGKAKVSWMLPAHPDLLAEAAQAGYSQPWPEVFSCFEIRQG